MIYPTRNKKIRTFASGGGTSSLFDNPGTYLGIQYVPTTPDLPDIEGLQYLMQQEDAELLQKQQAVAKSKEAFGAILDSFKELDGLSGETADAYNFVESSINNYYRKYDTPEKMISNEAVSDGARLQRSLLPLAVKLKNNKEIFTKQYADAEKVMPNVYFNNGLVYVRDEKTGRVKGVNYDEFRKSGQAETQKPLTIFDLMNYRMDNAGLDEMNISVNQYDRDTTRKYIREAFSNIGTSTSTFEGPGEYKELLKNVGLDPANLDIGRFKTMIKSGEANANTIYETMFQNFDSKARNAIIAQMIEDGEDPYATKTLGKDDKGNEMEISAYNARIHQIFTGEIARTLDSEQLVNIESTEETESKKTKSGSEEGSMATRLGVLLDPNISIDRLQEEFKFGNIKKIGDRYSPYSEKPLANVKTLAIRPSEEELETLLGRKPAFRPVTAEQQVIHNGKMVDIGETTSSSVTQKPVQYWELPRTGNVRIYEVPKYDPVSKTYVMEKMATQEIWIATGDTNSLGMFTDRNGEALTYDKAYKNTEDNVRMITSRDFKSEMAAYGIDAPTAELVGGSRGLNDLYTFPYVFLLKVEVPLNNSSPYIDPKDTVAKSEIGAAKDRITVRNKAQEDRMKALQEQKNSIQNFMKIQ